MHPNPIFHTHKQDLLVAYQDRNDRQHLLQDRVRQEAIRLATILVQEFGAQKVYAVGPLTYGQFTEGMPLEFAVEGMSREMIVRALAHVRQLSRFTIEISAVNELDRWTRDAVLRTGMILAQQTA
jgi:hypothetical protein